jgi:hypothetical protein
MASLSEVGAGSRKENVSKQKCRLPRMSRYRRSKKRMTMALVSAVLALSAATAWAGPCTSDIAQFEATVRSSPDHSLAGLDAREAIGALLGRQPTPSSVAKSEARLKAKFAATMARAKRYDAQANRLGCRRELARAKRMFVP